MNTVVSEKLQQIIAAGVNPVDAGYEDTDPRMHFPDEDFGPKAPAKSDAETLSKINRKWRNNLRKLYNSFEKKDMSFEAFCKAYRNLSNPVLIRRDAQIIAMQQRSGIRNKSRIDAALRN
jgi:uncharacterized protein (DUF4415 family)